MAIQEQTKRATSGPPTVEREHPRVLAVFIKESEGADFELGLERRVWGFSARGREYRKLRRGDWAIFGWGVPESDQGIADGGWQGVALDGLQICRITSEAYMEALPIWPSEVERDNSFMFRIGIEPIQRLEGVSLTDRAVLSEAAVDALRRSGLDQDRTGYVVDEDTSPVFDTIEVPDLFGIATRAMSDAPAETDTLGYGPLVEGLDTLVNDARTLLPLSIAINAPWGRGKSSLMLQLQTRLRRRRGPASWSDRTFGTSILPMGKPSDRSWEVVSFPAWKYEHGERLWAALAKEVYAQPQQKWSVPRRWWFRMKVEGAREGWWKVVSKVLVPVAVATGTAVATVETGAVDASAKALAAAVGGTTLLGTASRFWGILSDPFKRAIDRYARDPDYSEQLGFTSRANDDVQALTKVLTKRKGRCLAVFVDDLDRCSPASVVEVIETINQIFNAEKGTSSVFFLGMDVDLVAASIEVAYKDTVERLEAKSSPLADDFGRRFLAKVVQMSVTLPAVKRGVLGKLLEEVRVRPAADEGKLMRIGVKQASAMLGIDSRTFQRGYVAFARVVNRLTVGSFGRSLQQADERAARDGAAGPVGPPNPVTPDSPDIVRAERAALDHLEANPREVKRFDNAFRLQVYVANRTPDVKLDFGGRQLTALAKWMVLRVRWPELAGLIDEEPDRLARLERWALGERGDRIYPPLDAWLGVPEVMALIGPDGDELRLSELPLEGILRVT
jgi:hypothetical protein